jgi:hypothetical protein
VRVWVRLRDSGSFGFAQDDRRFGWCGDGRERSRSSRDTHLSDDETVAKMGHPDCGLQDTHATVAEIVCH